MQSGSWGTPLVANSHTHCPYPAPSFSFRISVIGLSLFGQVTWLPVNVLESIVQLRSPLSAVNRESSLQMPHARFGHKGHDCALAMHTDYAFTPHRMLLPAPRDQLQRQPDYVEKFQQFSSHIPNPTPPVNHSESALVSSMRRAATLAH